MPEIFSLISDPEGCVLFKDLPESAAEIRKYLENIEELTHDPHLIRHLQRCRECGQLYFYEFYEWVNFSGGEDPRYQTWVPVPDRETALQISQLSPMGVAMLKSIKINWPGTDAKPSKAFFFKKRCLTHLAEFLPLVYSW